MYVYIYIYARPPPRPMFSPYIYIYAEVLVSCVQHYYGDQSSCCPYIHLFHDAQGAEEYSDLSEPWRAHCFSSLEPPQGPSLRRAKTWQKYQKSGALTEIWLRNFLWPRIELSWNAKLNSSMLYCSGSSQNEAVMTSKVHVHPTPQLYSGSLYKSLWLLGLDLQTCSKFETSHCLPCPSPSVANFPSLCLSLPLSRFFFIYRVKWFVYLFCVFNECVCSTGKHSWHAFCGVCSVCRSGHIHHFSALGGRWCARSFASTMMYSPDHATFPRKCMWM